MNIEIMKLRLLSRRTIHNSGLIVFNVKGIELAQHNVLYDTKTIKVFCCGMARRQHGSELRYKCLQTKFRKNMTNISRIHKMYYFLA